MKLWSDFYDFILPELTDCPFIVADNALRQAAIEFCGMSLAWRYVHPDISVTNSVASYPYVAPDQTAVHTILYAEFNGREISATTGQDSIDIYDWRNAKGSPEIVLGGVTSITLVPKPDLEGTLKIRVALKPSTIAIGLDDDIFNEYRTSIIHGALGQLMLSPKKPYTNGELGMHHQQQFIIAAGQAGMRTARNYTRAPLQTQILSRGRRWG